MPVISVIMPVYNSSRFLRTAIDSILNQTFRDFEFLIFNDGSTDNSKAIILSYQDKRIKFYDDDVNLGYTTRLNCGLNIAQGQYVARMDSDDISLPARFEQQYNFLEANKDIVVCGGFFDFIENTRNSQSFNWVTNTCHDLLKINLLFDCAFCHPTVMIRNSVVKEYSIQYKKNFEPSEDYELWVNLSQKFRLANLEQKVLLYRVGENQVSNKNNERQRANKFLIIKEQLELLGITPCDVDLRIHDHMFYGTAILSYDYLPKLKAWTQRLIENNKTFKIYNQKKFEEYLYQLLSKNSVSFNEQLTNSTPKGKVIFLLKKALKWNSIR